MSHLHDQSLPLIGAVPLHKPIENHEQALLHDVIAALADAGLKHDSAAAFMGISGPQLSRQLSGREHLSAKRMSLLPSEFWGCFLVRRCRRFGLYTVPMARRRELIGQAVGWLLARLEEAS